MKYRLLLTLLVVKAVAFSQTEKIKIIDKIYSKSIIELTYVNHVPHGEYIRWNLDGTLKEKGVIDNSKINTDKIDLKFAANKTSVDSFYKAPLIPSMMKDLMMAAQAQ